MQQTKATIVSAIEAVKGAYLYRVEAPEIAAAARPGQFVMVRCGDETILPRPFSIHNAADGEISLLIGVVGKGTAWLAHKKQGDALDIFGPLGNGYRLDDKAGNILLVAGGLGIAPLRFLAERAAGAGKQVTILNGARSAALLIPAIPSQGMFNKGVRVGAVQCINATEDGSEGFKGLATQLIPHYLEKIDQVFACGPMSMYKTMAQMEALKNRPVQLSLEIMMGCGTGVCYGCTIKMQDGGLKQVCKDGPVFMMDEVVF
jgi:dihydroorotate dehydrogenase electron transfer subunit